MSRMSDLDIDLKNAARSRMGKNNRQRGNGLERRLAAELTEAGLAGIRVGHLGGKTDVKALGLIISAKKGGAYSERFDKWLNELTPKADEVAALVVEDAPGSGIKARRMVVIHWETLVQLLQQREEKS
jgi:Holliday junction resolvase